MSIAVMMKRRLRAAVPPLIFLLLAVYFGWNATRGDRGLVAQQQDKLDLAAAQVQLASANADVMRWEAKIDGLGDKALDLDALDGQARSMLNLVDPRDLVVMTSTGTESGAAPMLGASTGADQGAPVNPGQ
ncbi:FtsB family cell division protein [Acidisoma cladoniae]|jgi:cell division protein FtsB|uniref:FtsB family cell division protein n=1 Tax=Acidisoma cladoniae TaxID=3040935 RepID=UPI00254A7F5A|nr:septum formation initiator family protein [Acidisoma sp. PAMC 29798]